MKAKTIIRECCVVQNGHDPTFLYKLASELGYTVTVEVEYSMIISLLSVYPQIECIIIYSGLNDAFTLTRLTGRRIIAIDKVIYDSKLTNELIKYTPSENIGSLIHTLRLSGYTMHQIADLFNLVRLKPTKADKWTHNNVRQAYFVWKKEANDAQGTKNNGREE